MMPWPQIDTAINWCEGRVMHRRSAVAEHRFVYPVAFLRVPFSQLQSGRRWGGVFGINRAALFSLHERDHGARDGSPLLPWICNLLAEQGAVFELGEVVLQAFPRVCGYVFNPVSFWFCHDSNGQLRAVLCEVNNTFGEIHNYLLRHADLRPIVSGEVLEGKKVFHVSPFFSVKGNYRFRFLAQPHQAGANIEYQENGQLALLAHVGGRAQALSAVRLLGALLRFPFMTLGVMVRIHWHALQLWRKGAVFHRKPSPPQERTT
jgi:uncharacterized protein